MTHIPHDIRQGQAGAKCYLPVIVGPPILYAIVERYGNRGINGWIGGWKNNNRWPLSTIVEQQSLMQTNWHGMSSNLGKSAWKEINRNILEKRSFILDNTLNRQSPGLKWSFKNLHN